MTFLLHPTNNHEEEEDEDGDDINGGGGDDGGGDDGSGDGGVSFMDTGSRHVPNTGHLPGTVLSILQSSTHLILTRTVGHIIKWE